MKISKAHLALLTAVLIWSTTYAATKTALQETGPMNLALLRTIAAGIFLFLVVLAQKNLYKFGQALKKDWFKFLGLALLGVALFNSLHNIGLNYTTTGLASILINTSPLFVLLFARYFLKEKLTIAKIIGLTIGFIGIAFIIINGQSLSDILQSQTFKGNILLIGASICWTFFSILNKHLSKNYSALFLTTYASLFGIVFLLPVTGLLENLSAFQVISFKAWFAITYLGIVSSGIALLLWNYALSKMEASRASAFLYLVPVLAFAIGWVFLSEPITVYTGLGSILVLTGIYLTERNTQKS